MTSKRNFLQAGTAATVLAGMAVPAVHAAENNTIRFALVGCGGRGRGAAYQGLATNQGPVKLVALADVFRGQAAGFADMLQKDKPNLVDLPEDRVFGGMDAYKKAIDCLEPGRDAIFLATPPVFRPLHAEYAAKRGIHVFMEKSFGVDGPGVRRVLAAYRTLKEKGLKVMTGLNNRKYIPTAETVKAIHDGMIGDIMACYVYRFQGALGYGAPGDTPPLQYQLRNYNTFSWVGGTPALDWAIHNIDIACWAKQMQPTWVQGCGGRAVRTAAKDDAWDHLANEYIFEDGVRMIVAVRLINNTWGSFRSVIVGTKGMAIVGEGIGNPRIHKNFREDSEVIWKPESRGNDSYQEEINRLFQAIREDGETEDVEDCIQSVMTGIMGRMAMESGQELSRDTALNSTYEMCPGIDDLTLESDSPWMPDADGNYVVPKPGITKRF